MNSYEIFYNTITIKWHFFNEVSYMNTGEKYSVVLEEDAKHLREKKTFYFLTVHLNWFCWS